MAEQARRAGLAPTDYLRRFIAEQGMEFKFDPTYSSEWTDDDLRDASLASLRKLTTDPALALHDAAWSLYNRDLKVDLEREHLGQVVAIDPVSGSYEVAHNSPDARRALRKRCPDGPIVAIRIGVVPVDNALSLRARNVLRRTRS